MTDILTESVVAPSILKPTVQHTDNSHASSNNCWLGSLLSIANKALAPQLALASPRPTAPPHPLIVSRILLNRQTAQTCGYINADVFSPATCSPGSTCVSNTINSVHYCCEDAQNCIIPTTCLASTAVSASCGPDCQSDALTLKCTFTNFPFCYTRYWNETPPLSGFGCASSSFVQTVYTTYIGEDSDVTFSESASATNSGITTVSSSSATGSAFASATNGGTTTVSSSSVSTSLRPNSSFQNSPSASSNTAPAKATDSSVQPSSTTGLFSSSTTESIFSSPSGASNLISPSTSASLSHGAIAGIAVGGFFALILLLALGGLIHKKFFQPEHSPSPKHNEFGPGKSQGVSDGPNIFGLEDIRPRLQDGFRSDSSTIVSPTAEDQSLVPGEPGYRTPYPAHLPPPRSRSSWDPSIPPPRR